MNTKEKNIKELLSPRHWEEIIQLRHLLHQHPETAHQEKQTAAYIHSFLSSYAPDQLITNIGGYGIAAVYKSSQPGPTTMFRCDLDGLPIEEKNTIPHLSKNKGKAHLCGHDGHMATISALAVAFSIKRPPRGRIVLLFQPAEETGEGAFNVLKDPQFKAIEPDYIFAYHNLPGYKKGQIILKESIFASASEGMVVRLTGTPSHASHPENGKNPSLAAAQIVQSLMAISQMSVPMHRSALITPIHIRIGQAAFGTSPGEGDIMFTLRSHENKDMETISLKAIEQAEQIAAAHGLKCAIEWTERFEAVTNNTACTKLIHSIAESNDISIQNKEEPFSWSEDFGHFTSLYKGALFGIGAGINQPQLHNENYDFPDEILEPAASIFYQIAQHIHSPTSKPI